MEERRYGRGPLPPNETPAERFSRLAKFRVNGVVERMRGLSNLARHPDYEWTPEQAAEIIAQVQKALDRLKADFTPPS